MLMDRLLPMGICRRKKNSNYIKSSLKKKKQKNKHRKKNVEDISIFFSELFVDKYLTQLDLEFCKYILYPITWYFVDGDNWKVKSKTQEAGWNISPFVLEAVRSFTLKRSGQSISGRRRKILLTTSVNNSSHRNVDVCVVKRRFDITSIMFNL